MKKRALIIGETLSVISTTQLLIRKSYRVSVICKDRLIATGIAKNVGISVICGESLHLHILHDTKMQNAEIAIVMLREDEDNFVTSLLCKRLLKVKKVVSILENEKRIDDFYRSGIDYVVCQTISISNLIDQKDFLNGIATLVPVSDGRVSVVEVRINATAPVVGKKLWEIELPSDVIVGCVLRKDRSIVPRGDTRISAEDTLILIASDKQEIAAVQILTGL